MSNQPLFEVLARTRFYSTLCNIVSVEFIAGDLAKIYIKLPVELRGATKGEFQGSTFGIINSLSQERNQIMATQHNNIRLINANTTAEMKLVKANGTYKKGDEILTGDLYADDNNSGNAVLLVTKVIKVENLTDLTIPGPKEPHK